MNYTKLNVPATLLLALLLSACATSPKPVPQPVLPPPPASVMKAPPPTSFLDRLERLLSTSPETPTK